MVNLFFTSTAEANGRYYRKRFGIDGEALVSVSLSLDTGNISEPYNVVSRREVYNANFLPEASISGEIKRLYKALKNDDQLCFWYSAIDVNEYLGMLASVSQFGGGALKLYLADCTRLCESLSKLQLDEEKVPDLRHPLSADEIGKLLGEWERIRVENAAVRIIKGGKVAGFPDNYIDDAIYSVMGDNSIKTSALFERFPWTHYPVSATFMNYRIRQLISDGRIDVVELGWDPYGSYGAPMKIRARNIISKHT